MLNGLHFRKQIAEFAMDICGSVLLHCMFCMLRGQNLAPLNCGISFETLLFLKNSHFIEYKLPGRAMASKQRGVHVSLRNVTPIVPENEQERAMLKDDLHGLGCAGLLERPWNLKNEEFIQEFVMIRE